MSRSPKHCARLSYGVSASFQLMGDITSVRKTAMSQENAFKVASFNRIGRLYVSLPTHIVPDISEIRVKVRLIFRTTLY